MRKNIYQNQNNIKEKNPLLVGITGEFASQKFEILRSGIMMGRDPISCNIIFSDKTPGISRHHCIIFYNTQTNMFIIKDLNSMNGTYLQSGIAIKPENPTAIYAGSRFWLCDEKNIFELRAE